MKKTGIDSVEIARLAGVSRSTVSRVINNYSNVPPETREKVMQVIRQYNYVPNASAQVLAGKRTRTIGLFMIEAGHVSADILTNLMLASIIENASTLGYYVLTRIIRNTRDEDAVRSVKEIFYQRRIDGGIFIGAANREPFIEELVAEGFMVGIVDQELSGNAEPNRIVANFDNHGGMRLAVEYLHKLGHRRIGVLNGDMNRCSGPSKYEGFLAAMRHYGLEIDPQRVLPGGFSEESGYQSMSRFLDEGMPLPSAMIMANDSVAFGAIRALQEHGLQVPRDLSVIGFDDHPLSSRTHPALTTLKVDFADMMGTLTASLVRHIEGEETGYAPFSVRNDLIVRDSCRPIIFS
ncbi:LacI family DNA-binding transcriptional regulator [Cohnella sp. CFH 77786]|uniref:LacI family DNA-binding transcriptional regulator n=1 Tax=Cohnella sp. CFH 77786 TaxID=2662265 RepID=UPI001C609F18|nr:LacI family DNA-binding transcriptional regulator [Cohnella sp. CFH 77786]MBW5447472.1 LacI family DNA-binding transcriptional regulator [Cohnella sp. CFH 77786]